MKKAVLVLTEYYPTSGEIYRKDHIVKRSVAPVCCPGDRYEHRASLPTKFGYMSAGAEHLGSNFSLHTTFDQGINPHTTIGRSTRLDFNYDPDEASGLAYRSMMFHGENGLVRVIDARVILTDDLPEHETELRERVRHL